MNVEAFDFDGDYGEEYEALARRVIPGYESLFPMATSILDPLLPTVGRALVVGAGTGIEVLALKAARPDLEIVGVDPSERMLALAKRRLEKAGIHTGVSLHHGYAHEIAPTPLFDAATLMNVLHFVPDDGGKAALLTDVAERLAPDAPLVLFDLHGDPASEEFARYMPAWRRFWSLRGMNKAECAQFDKRIREGIHFVSPARILELAAKAGFTRPRMFYKSLLYGGWTFRRSPSP